VGDNVLALSRSFLPYHQRIYACVMGVTIVSQFIWPTEWWFFWPLLIWTVIFTLHLMVMRTIDVDEDWVDERSDKVADNAFDFGQMEAIRKKASRTGYGEAYGSVKENDSQEK